MKKTLRFTTTITFVVSTHAQTATKKSHHERRCDDGRKVLASPRD